MQPEICGGIFNPNDLETKLISKPKGGFLVLTVLTTPAVTALKALKAQQMHHARRV